MKEERLRIINNFWEKLRDPVLHVVLIGAILIIGVTAFRVSFKAVEKQSDPWLEQLEPVSKLPDKQVCERLLLQLPGKDNPKAKEPISNKPAQGRENKLAQCDRLIEQLKYTQSRIVLHSKLMSYLFTRMYAALITALATGLLATLTLVFITREGWKDANSYLLATFLSFAVLTGFYGMFPSVFEQKKNAEANKSLCLAYDTVSQDISNYFVTGLDETGNPVSLDNYISSVGKRLTKLRSLPFDMNPDEIVALSQRVRDVLEQQAKSGKDGS